MQTNITAVKLPEAMTAPPEAEPSALVKRELDARVKKINELRNVYGKAAVERARHHLQQCTDIIGERATIELLRL